MTYRQEFQRWKRFHRDELETGLRVLFNAFLTTEPDNYDYTVSNVSNYNTELVGW